MSSIAIIFLVNCYLIFIITALTKNVLADFYFLTEFIREPFNKHQPNLHQHFQ